MPRHRSYIALTVWPILVLFLLELARFWPALRGAPAFASASPASWVSLIACTFVALVFLAAYVRAWNLLGRGDPGSSGPYRSFGCLRLQKLAGGLAWGLLVAHLALHWAMTLRVGPVALSQYELLRGFLSRPPVLGFYLLGLAAFGLFISQGLAASLRVWGLGRRPESSRWLEVGCTLAAAVMVLMAVNVLSHFATGRAYWSPPSLAEEPPVPGSTEGER